MNYIAPDAYRAIAPAPTPPGYNGSVTFVNMPEAGERPQGPGLFARVAEGVRNAGDAIRVLGCLAAGFVTAEVAYSSLPESFKQIGAPEDMSPSAVVSIAAFVGGAGLAAWGLFRSRKSEGSANTAPRARGHEPDGVESYIVRRR